MNALPKIVVIIGKDDYGEFGAASCPHCGADGRYIYRFLCDDGSERGAMAGCIQHFPMHPFACEMQRIVDKETAGKRPNSWDIAIRDAILDFFNGKISEHSAEVQIRDEKRKRAAWMKKRFR